MSEPHPREPRPGDWRVRGMATLPAMRGLGLGSAVLAACESHAAGAGGKRLWCNARVGARGFYERAGLTVEGGVFEIAGIGPHVLMTKRLA
jgi:GNAT superfamily N-acetyltransferase